MTADKIFVGRKAELAQFTKVLEDLQGQAVLVVGNRGMGKTWLINKMAELAENHPDFNCNWVRYEVTPTDSVDSTMAMIMDNAFEAAQVAEKSLDSSPRRLQQWKALLNVIKIGDLVMSLRRDPSKNSRDQFLERLQLISKRMPENGRAIFIIDPEKYMQKDCDQSWAIVVKELPDKIKLVFAQRTEDVLVESTIFADLDNISHIPEKRLGILEEQAVDELLNQRITEMDYSMTEVRKILGKYKGHPYALQGALDLLKAGTKLEELPNDPTGIAAAQWKESCKRGKDAIRLFKAYAILEVGVPDEVVTAVSDLDTDTVQSMLTDNYLGGLLREEGYGKRIYHTILADYIFRQIGQKDHQKYHMRAVWEYKKRLTAEVKPDALAALRLPEHVLAAEGDEAFVEVFTNACYGPLTILGLLDTAISLSVRALKVSKEGSAEKAMVLGNLGVSYRKRGQLDEAQRVHEKALEIGKKLGLHQVISTQYGSLGLIFRMRGDLEKAEWLVRKGLIIDEEFERLEGMASKYANLGVIHQMRGDLDKAEQMYKKSLQINKRLDRKRGMANAYASLASVHEYKGNLDKAERLHRLALAIEVELGIPRGIARQYGNLGVIYGKSDQLVKAEQMLEKALEINKKFRWLEGIASDYSNLGIVCEQRGDIEKAGEYWELSLELFKKIGMRPEIEKVQRLIDELKNK